jgi:drug/metabolite transporter (DMT)-like permease
MNDLMAIPRWFLLSIFVAVLWGVWGALIELPERHFNPGFPGTLGYVVWSLTMLPCALVALRRIGWRVDRKRAAVVYGSMVGFTGAAGQLVLFRVLHEGPAYLVFPIISLAPVVTIALAFLLLRERTHSVATTGVLLSLVAILFLSIQQPGQTGPVRGYAWLAGTLAVFVMWGIQSYFAKASAGVINEESLFFYMAIWALALSPLAWRMTDLSVPVNWGLSGPYLAALIQFPNALGALLSIFALRSGKAMIVSPTINGLFPVITIVLSLAIYGRLPERWNAIGMVLAVTAIVLMSYGEALQSERDAAPRRESP